MDRPIVLSTSPVSPQGSRRSKSRARRGFTIVELLAVILIIALLAATFVGVAGYGGLFMAISLLIPRALLVGTRTVYGLVLLMRFSMMMEYSKRPSAPISLRMIFLSRPM